MTVRRYHEASRLLPGGLTGIHVQDAIDVAPAGGTVQLAAREYLLDAPIVLRGGVRLKGRGSTLRVVSPVESAVLVTAGTLEQVAVDCAELAEHGITATKAHGRDILRAVSVRGAVGYGIDLVACASARLDRVVVVDSGAGLRARGCNASQVTMLHVARCAATGLRIEACPEQSYWGGVHVSGGVIEHCAGDSVVVDSVQGDCSVERLYLESCRGEAGGGVIVHGRGVVIDRVSVRGMLGEDQTQRAVWVREGAVGTVIRDCLLAYQGGGQDPPYWRFAAIRDDGTETHVAGCCRPAPFNTPPAVERPVTQVEQVTEVPK
ncbi:MAG: hypothetical protein ABIL09_11155 [Gemmatimonadota bacterium]